MIRCFALLLLLGSATFAWSQVPAERAGASEFPALQVLPVGSVVEGISIPRYEGGRVTSLVRAQRLTITTRKLLNIDKLLAYLYDKHGYETRIEADKGSYDFGEGLVRSQGSARLTDERIQCDGQQIYYKTADQQGLMRGPVRTVSPASQNRSR